MFKSSEEARAAAQRRHQKSEQSGPLIHRGKLPKSGDAKRADAETATQEDRLNDKASPEALPELLQGKVDEAKENGASPSQVAIMEASIRELTKALTGIHQKVITLEQLKLPVVQKPMVAMKCPTCQQVIADSDGRGVCNGVHRMAQVMPKDFNLWKNFPGVHLNGAYYAGNCFLPEAIVQNVLLRVNAWEESEKRKSRKGGMIFGEVDAKKGRFGYTPILAAA